MVQKMGKSKKKPQKEDNGEEMRNIQDTPILNENASTSKTNKQEHEGNDEEMNNVEEDASNVKMASPPMVIEQQKEDNDEIMNNVEEETPNVKMASPLKTNKQKDLQRGGGGNVKGIPVVVGEEENGIPVIEVKEQEKGIPVIEIGEKEKGIQEQEKTEAEEEEKGLQKEIEKEAEEEEKGLQKEIEKEAEAEDNVKISLNMEEKTPNVPKKPVATEGNVVFVGNVADTVSWVDLVTFFKDVGAVTDIRFAKNRKGFFRGFAHVDFATDAAAMKALEKDGLTLHGRNVDVELAEKRGTRLNEEKWRCTAYVRGFGKKQEEDEIENILRKHFGSCGSIVGVDIPKDQKSKCLKGFAYIQFVDCGAVMKAVELNGSEMERHTFFVEKAKSPMHGKSGGGSKSGKRKRNPNEP